MQRERQQLSFRKSKLHRVASLCLGIFLSLSLITRPVQASDVAGNPSMKIMVGLIIQLNAAMQSAAENPMDKWRRQNVAHAYAMLPMGLMKLADEFKQRKLVNSDLPTVQAMLGGFVDPSATERMKKFMRSPTKDLIPQVGKNFPGKLTTSGSSGSGEQKSYTYNESISKNSGTGATPNATGNSLTADLVDLEGSAAQFGSVPGKKESAAEYTYTDIAKPTGSGSGSPNNFAGYESGGYGGAASAGLAGQAARDLASMEGASEPVVQFKKPESSLNNQEEFFKNKKENKKNPPSGRYNLEVKPKYWNVLPLATIELGHAEECSQKESGDQGAQAMQMLAMAMMAAAPMVAAAIQADADKQIAQTNANAQIQMTQISSDTSKYLADQQAAVAQQQTEAAAQVAAQNQAATTERLEMQLEQLDKSQQQAYELQQQQLAYQQELDQQRIELAEQQAQQSIQLAQQQYRMQLSAAGLSEGFTQTQNSAAGLSVSPTAGQPFPSTVPGGTTVASTSPTGTTGLPSTGLGVTMASTGSSGSSTQRGVASTGSTASNRLITSATGTSTTAPQATTTAPPATGEGEWVMIDGKMVWVPKAKPTPTTIPTTAPVTNSPTPTATASNDVPVPMATSPSLKGVMASNTVVRGSTPQTIPPTTPPPSQSDLTNFVSTTTPPASTSFSTYYTQETATVTGTSVPTTNLMAPTENTSHSSAARGVTTAYNADGLEKESAGRTGYRGASRPVAATP